MSRETLCDFWLETRSKCPEQGTEKATDRHGAPLYFCKPHMRLMERDYAPQMYAQPVRRLEPRP